MPPGHSQADVRFGRLGVPGDIRQQFLSDSEDRRGTLPVHQDGARPGGESAADGTLLLELARRLNDEMELLGVEREEREYQNHVTLARVREPKPLPRLAEQMEKCQGRRFGTMTVDQIVLMQSTLKPTGPVYTPVERIPLAG